MVLVLFFLGLVILLVLIFVCLLISNIQISIENLKIDSSNKEQIIKDQFVIRLKMYLFKKIKILSIKFDKKRIQKIYLTQKEKLEKIDPSEVLKTLPINTNTIKQIKKREIELSNLDFKINLGLEDVILTTSVVGILSVLFPLFLSLFIDKYDSKRFEYEIKAKYNQKMSIDLSLDCKIDISIKEIVFFFLYVLKQKKKKENKENKKMYQNKIGYNYN